MTKNLQLLFPTLHIIQPTHATPLLSHTSDQMPIPDHFTFFQISPIHIMLHLCFHASHPLSDFILNVQIKSVTFSSSCPNNLLNLTPISSFLSFLGPSSLSRGIRHVNTFSSTEHHVVCKHHQLFPVYLFLQQFSFKTSMISIEE